MSQIGEWKELFRLQDATRLALAARQAGAIGGDKCIRALGDDQMLLLGGASEAARLSKRAKRDSTAEPICVVVTPEQDQSEDEFAKLLSQAKKDFPNSELAGFGPTGFCKEFDRLILKVGQVGVAFQPDEQSLGKAKYADRVTAVLVYTPEATAEALEQSVKACESIQSLETVVVLPLGAGDRIPLPGLTTAGTLDMMMISALRLLLPPAVNVRASWAALGWKVCQLAICYGATELAGWSAAETAVYSGRVRAAARVEEDELVQGIAEAGWQRKPWCAVPAGVRDE